MAYEISRDVAVPSEEERVYDITLYAFQPILNTSDSDLGYFLFGGLYMTRDPFY